MSELGKIGHPTKTGVCWDGQHARCPEYVQNEECTMTFRCICECHVHRDCK